jgi:diguanylate cyclase (GGDEF)-like protein/PAS domain S-box-containing protein
MLGLSTRMKRHTAEGGATHLFATWGLAFFVALACAGSIGLEVYRVISQRSEALENARLVNVNLTGSLIQHAEQIFRSADGVLTGIVDRLEHDARVPEGRDRLRGWFMKELQLSTHFASLGVADSNGNFIVSSRGEKDAPQLSDREYFVYHRNHDDMGVHIGNVIRGRSGWVIPVTRRVNNADGTFGGVAIATINARYFQDLYDRLEIGRNAVVALTTADKSQVLVRRPFVEANIGRDVSNSAIMLASKNTPKGTLEYNSQTDGVLRLNSYERGRSYPIVVNVAQDVDELLAPWRRSALRSLVETITMAAVILLMGGFAWRAARTLSKNSMALHETNNRFDAALANMPAGLSMFDADGRLQVWNKKFLDLYGMSPAIVRRGASLADIIAHRRGLGHHELERHASERLRGELNASGSYERTVRLKDGRTTLITNTSIAGGGWVGIHEDITERIRHEEALFKQSTELARINLRFDMALSHMTQGLCMFDENKRLVVWNRRYAELHDVPEALLKVGTPFEALVTDQLSRGVVKGYASPDAINARVAELIEFPKDSQRVEELADGRFVLLSRQPMPGGGWLSVMEDITERKRAEAEIVHLARHDVLTGLANRAEFNERLTEAAQRVKRRGAAIAVMMLDLDKFKAVNDTLGHPAGDLLLIEVGRRLQTTIRETDLLARLGGDEFAIIQQGASNQHESAIALALRIIDAISAPFDLDGHEASVGISIGIAMAPEHGSDPEELLKSADLALYDAKANGRNDFRIYDTDLLKIAHTQQSAEEELRDAIKNREFELHYQPIVEVKTSRVCGVEALVRWRHPEKGLIAPDGFIPLAESTGLINPLGEWILQQACSDAVSWPDHIKLAINISAVQFKKGNLLEIILCALVGSGLAAERLELEITETSLLENQQAHLATLRQLKNLGITMALDDFGTGYSSVTYLTNFPFDKIKVDRTFTKEILNRRDYAAVVSSVLALAQGVGALTTVEGIETEPQFEYMRQAGADLAQGFLFGRPVPLSQLDFTSQALPSEKPMVARAL